MHNEYQVEYNAILSVFTNSMAVIVEDDDGIYTPYERQAWGDYFDDYVLNTLIEMVTDKTAKASIKEKINSNTIHNIDLVIAWVGASEIHAIHFFSNVDNQSVTLILQDEHMVDSITLNEFLSGDSIDLVPLSNAMVIISNTEDTAN